MDVTTIEKIDKLVAKYRERLIILYSDEEKYSLKKIDKAIIQVFKEHKNAYISKCAVSCMAGVILKVEPELLFRINRKIEARMVILKDGPVPLLKMTRGRGYRMVPKNKIT